MVSRETARQQVEVWQRCLPDEPIRIVKEILGEGFSTPVPFLHGEYHPVIKIASTPCCDLGKHEGETRRRLDKIGWEWVTLRISESGQLKRFGIAPLFPRQATGAYHATLKSAIPDILENGLLPSTRGIRQTDFPDTEGRIHLAELLEGNGSAVRWIRLFSEKYNRPQSEYGILQADLRDVGGRMYQDAHSEFGLVIDRIDRIVPERIRVVQESGFKLEDGAG